MLNRFLEEILTQNIKRVELDVKINNNVAIEFYRKHGFAIIDIIPKFYQSGEDAYTMQLAL